MKKLYQSPEIECKHFLVTDILTTSGVGEGDAAGDNLKDDENIEPWT